MTGGGHALGGRPGFWEAVRITLRGWGRHIGLCVLITLPFAALTGTSSAMLDLLTLEPGAGASVSGVVAGGLGSVAALGTLVLAYGLLLPLASAVLAAIGAGEVFGVDAGGTRRAAPAVLAERGPTAVGAFLLTILAVAAAPAGLGLLALAAGIALGPLGLLPFGLLAAASLVWPAFFYLIRFSLAVPVAVSEQVDAAGALRRSSELVRGGFWWVLGVLGVTAVTGNLLGAVAAVVALPLGAESFAGMSVRGGISLLVAASISGVAGGVVYATRNIPAFREPEEESVYGSGTARETGPGSQ